MKSKTFFLLVLAVFVLTVGDYALTAVGVRLGVIAEGNPLLQSAMARPILAAVALSLAVGGLLAFIYRFGRRYKHTAMMLAGVCAVKLVVMGLHFGWIMAV